MMPPQSLLTERFMEFNFIELLGYLATFFVAVSFLFIVNLYQLYRLKKEQPASKVLK